MKWLILSLLFFLLIANIYSINIVSNLDIKITLFFEEIRSPIMNQLFLFITDLGSIKYMFPICIVFAILLIVKRKLIDVFFLIFMFYSVRQINYQLKEFFLRERPSYQAVYEASHYSFPSGHSMNSIAIYFFLYYLLTTNSVFNGRQRSILLIVTIILVLLIGISRIYLGVHYFTDVIAGFSAGFAWFIVLQLIIRKMKHDFDKN